MYTQKQYNRDKNYFTPSFWIICDMMIIMVLKYYGLDFTVLEWVSVFLVLRNIYFGLVHSVHVMESVEVDG